MIMGMPDRLPPVNDVEAHIIGYRVGYAICAALFAVGFVIVVFG